MLVFRILAFILSFGIGAGPSPTGSLHDLKMSVCETTFLPRSQSFELKFYLFQDDFREVLYNDPLAEKLDVEDATAYILKHFELLVNGQKQPVSFQSVREKGDQVLLQFTSAKISSGISKVQVKNTLLIEKFRKQTNMVYLILPGKSRQTLMLNASKAEGAFSI